MKRYDFREFLIIFDYIYIYIITIYNLVFYIILYMKLGYEESFVTLRFIIIHSISSKFIPFAAIFYLISVI